MPAGDATVMDLVAVHVCCTQACAWSLQRALRNPPPPTCSHEAAHAQPFRGPSLRHMNVFGFALGFFSLTRRNGENKYFFFLLHSLSHNFFLLYCLGPLFLYLYLLSKSTG